MRWISAVVVAMLVLTATMLSGCASLPRDPDHTLDQVRVRGDLRVGASPSAGRVAIENDRVAGPEAELIRGYADSLGVRVTWRAGGEEELVTAMERGEIDVLIGGLSDSTPWETRLAVTRPFDVADSDDASHGYVMAVPLGENAMLLSLQTYLDGARR